MIKRMAFIFVSVILTGCAGFKQHEIKLTYPPPKPKEIYSSSMSKPEGLDRQKVLIVLNEFSDNRASATKMDTFTNSLGWEGGGTFTNDDVPAWVIGGLEYELKRVGYQVVRGKDSRPNSNLVLEVKGIIEELSNLKLFLNVKVLKGSEEAFKGKIRGKAFVATTNSLLTKYPISLQDACVKLIRVIDLISVGKDPNAKKTTPESD